MEKGQRDVRLLALKLEEGGHKPRNTGGSDVPEKARMWIFTPRACRKSVALPTLFGILTPRPVDHTFVCLQAATMFVVIYHCGILMVEWRDPVSR